VKTGTCVEIRNFRRPLSSSTNHVRSQKYRRHQVGRELEMRLNCSFEDLGERPQTSIVLRSGRLQQAVPRHSIAVKHARQRFRLWPTMNPPDHVPELRA